MSQNKMAVQMCIKILNEGQSHKKKEKKKKKKNDCIHKGFVRLNDLAALTRLLRWR